MPRRKEGPGLVRGYAFAWVTAGFFVVSLTGHWLFGWFAYVNEQHAHKQPIERLRSLHRVAFDREASLGAADREAFHRSTGIALLHLIRATCCKQAGTLNIS